MKNLDHASSCCQEEKLPSVFPRHLVYLEAKLDVLKGLHLSHLYQRYVVLFVAYGNMLPVRTPPNIDILSARLDCICALSEPRIPNAYGLVARCSA